MNSLRSRSRVIGEQSRAVLDQGADAVAHAVERAGDGADLLRSALRQRGVLVVEAEVLGRLREGRQRAAKAAGRPQPEQGDADNHEQRRHPDRPRDGRRLRHRRQRRGNRIAIGKHHDDALALVIRAGQRPEPEGGPQAMGEEAEAAVVRHRRVGGRQWRGRRQMQVGKNRSGAGDGRRPTGFGLGGDRLHHGGQFSGAVARWLEALTVPADIEAHGNDAVDCQQRQQNKDRDLPADAIEEEAAHEAHAGATAGVNR